MVVGLERVDRAALSWKRVLDLGRVKLVKDELLQLGFLLRGNALQPY